MAGTWVRTGTVAVTNGSKKVTGVGTSWLSNLLQKVGKGCMCVIDNVISEVDYVNSDTELYLVEAWEGATASGKKYKIQVTVTDTIPELSSRISQSLAYANGQYGNLESWTTSQAETVTLTSPAGVQVTVPSLGNMLSKNGNLFGLTDKSIARNNLSLGNASTKDVQSSQIDTDTNHLMPAGAFGLGATKLPRVFDANTVWANGWYEYNTDVGDVEGPQNERYGTIFYTGHAGNGMYYFGWQYQIFFSIYGDMYVRHSAVNTFQGMTWRRCWNELSFKAVSGSWTPYVDDPAIIVQQNGPSTWIRNGNSYNIHCHLNISGNGSLSGNRFVLRGLPFNFGNKFRAIPIYEANLLAGAQVKNSPAYACITGSEVQFFHKNSAGVTEALFQELVRPAANGSIELIINATIFEGSTS